MCRLTRMYSYTDIFERYITTHPHTPTHRNTYTTTEVNSADFPCQLLGRHWFKETSICDVSTYLMNPLRSMKALVRYTACRHCPACFYVYTRTLLGSVLDHNMPRCVCASSCLDKSVLICPFLLRLHVSVLAKSTASVHSTNNAPDQGPLQVFCV